MGEGLVVFDCFCWNRVCGLVNLVCVLVGVFFDVVFGFGGVYFVDVWVGRER